MFNRSWDFINPASAAAYFRPFTQIQAHNLVNVKLKWVKDAALDPVVSGSIHLKATCTLISLIASAPNLSLPIHRPQRFIDSTVQIEHEDMAVMGLIKSNEWVVMLDERGRDVSSEQMASLIADAGNTGASSILFCIGGPYGHGRQLRERADVSIRLSSLVLNHEIALVVLAEQLYRAWTILKGQKYHH
ncbi:putative RNA methyltransferase At5g10620 isoform X1 [Salvia splendens]|uniref:putative RNA methyltransferase At5g10620 isoform X1 n=1 Tax=Salvia splendens TaxID=180675 RepID=UPI001C26D16E|nr:putative RNA methyltransferase At5g10620 isoform X1 [Salvia splendens]